MAAGTAAGHLIFSARDVLDFDGTSEIARAASEGIDDRDEDDRLRRPLVPAPLT